MTKATDSSSRAINFSRELPELPAYPLDLKILFHEYKLRAVSKALKLNKGKITLAARDLGMSRTCLSMFIKKYRGEIRL